MVRLTSPLTMILPFSRRKNSNAGSDSEKTGRKIKGAAARKISIDHTVLSGDDSHHMKRQLSSASPSHGGLDESNSCRSMPDEFFQPGNFSHHYAGVSEYQSGNAYAATSAMHPSTSEPSFLDYCQEPDGSGVRDCFMAQQRQRHSTNTLPPPCGGLDTSAVCGPLPGPPFSAPHQQQIKGGAYPQQPSGGTDPALQARIEGIRIQEQMLGENHPDVIFALTSLAKLHKRRGNHAMSVQFFREAQTRGIMGKQYQKTSPSSPLGAAYQATTQNPQEQNVPMEIFFPH